MEDGKMKIEKLKTKRLMEAISVFLFFILQFLFSFRIGIVYE
jgi:hypothetical protein